MGAHIAGLTAAKRNAKRNGGTVVGSSYYPPGRAVPSNRPASEGNAVDRKGGKKAPKKSKPRPRSLTAVPNNRDKSEGKGDGGKGDGGDPARPPVTPNVNPHSVGAILDPTFGGADPSNVSDGGSYHSRVSAPAAAARRGASNRSGRGRRVRVGEVYTSAAQVRAELDRVDARWLALKRDIVGAIASDATGEPGEYRTGFLDAFARWRAFYADARRDWLAWGSNVTQAETFDSELDNWRARYATLTGREPSSPLTSESGRRYRATGDWFNIGTGAFRWGAAAVALGAVAWGLSSVSRAAR